MTIDRQIAKLGWNLERTRNPCEPELHWASQGGFVTPRRPSPEEVLEDILSLSRIEKALDKAEAKLAD